MTADKICAKLESLGTDVSSVVNWTCHGKPGIPIRLQPTVRYLLVSVRRVLESYESVVIQGWWPDSKEVTDVDAQEPRTLRPQQVAISE